MSARASKFNNSVVPTESAADILVASVSAVVGVLLVAVPGLSAPAILTCGALLLAAVSVRLTAAGCSWRSTWRRCGDSSVCGNKMPSRSGQSAPRSQAPPTGGSTASGAEIEPHLDSEANTFVALCRAPTARQATEAASEKDCMLCAAPVIPTTCSVPVPAMLPTRGSSSTRTSNGKATDKAVQTTAEANEHFARIAADRMLLSAQLEDLKRDIRDLQVKEARLQHCRRFQNARLFRLAALLTKVEAQKKEIQDSLSQENQAHARLSQQLVVAQAEVSIAKTREEHLREAGRLRTAILVRLAAQVHQARAAVKASSSHGSCAKETVAPSEKRQDGNSPTRSKAARTGEKLVTETTNTGDEHVNGVPSPQRSPLGGAAASDIISRLRNLAMENRYLKERLNAVKGSAGSPDFHDDLQTPTSMVSTASQDSKGQILRRLENLASENRDLKLQLDAAEAERQQELTGQLNHTSRQPQQPDPPSSVANAWSVRDEIVSKLAQAAKENAELKASLEGAAETHRQELMTMTSQRDAADRHAESLSAEVKRLKTLAWARDCSDSGTMHPQLSIKWSDGMLERWPGGPGPLQGVEALRESLLGQNAELTLGPPPNDWRAWLQLGLRRGEPAHPAFLQLAVSNAVNGGRYVGLMWPAHSS